MLIIEGNRRVALGSSLNDVVTWLEQTPRTWSAHNSVEHRAENAWDMGVGYDGALALARNGWHNGAVGLYDALNARPAPVTMHSKTTNSVAGEYPDVGRYLSGSPDCMRRRGHDAGARPVLTLVCNVTPMWDVSAQCTSNFGSALAALIDKLEASGRRVELYSVFSTQLARGDYVFGWNVKQARDPMDLSAVAFSIAHPASLRRIGFAMEERTPQDWRMSNYGMPRNLTQADAELMGLENAFVINGTGRSLSVCTTVDAALRFAVQQINLAAAEELATLEG